MPIAGAARIAAVAAVVALGAGCSAEVTRLSQPFFADSDVTGSLPPIPQADIGAPGASAAAPTPVAAVPSRREPIASAPAGPMRGSVPPIQSAAVPQVAGDGFTMVYAESGDTVYSLSRRHGVSARAIMAANRLSRPEDLRPGQKVLIPPVTWRPDSPFPVGIAERSQPTLARNEPQIIGKEPPFERTALPASRVHVVKPGDTLYAIARANGLTAADLARHNRLQSADRLSVGQRLEIPASAPVRVTKASNFANDAGEPLPVATPRKVAPE